MNGLQGYFGLQNNMKSKKQCNTCTRRLVEEAYQSSFTFRLFREPLKFLIRKWVKAKKIDLSVYQISNESCLNCNRFSKNALKDNSRLFRVLNSVVNPIFDYWLVKIVSSDEIDKAKKHAIAILNNNELPTGWNKNNDFKKWKAI